VNLFLAEEKYIKLKGINPIDFFGFQDNNLSILEEALSIEISGRGNELIMRGESDNLEKAERVVNELLFMINKNGPLSAADIETVTRFPGVDEKSPKTDHLKDVILYTKSSYIKPKNKSQENYFKATRDNDIVVSIGPAGTGKTYLAVAVAVAQLKEREVNRIILCRPAVEAGESLGFLPGDLQEKVDPYLRPLYDALYEMVSPDKLQRQLERRVIEIVPLAYMRGRTLNSSFVILDEAQNTTASQMKMFLTRLGANSKAIITGDITQIDLPSGVESGLVQIQSILTGIDGIEFVYFSKKDVVRHRLVMEIISAYEKLDKEQK
jgi:phosphate starvation-inducible PhoH-like protein